MIERNHCRTAPDLSIEICLSFANSDLRHTALPLKEILSMSIPIPMRVLQPFALILLPVALALSGCERGVTQDKNSQAVLTVETVLAQERSMPTVIETSGPLAAWQEVVIGSEISGYRVSEVTVDIGTVVSKGRVLAKLDDTLLRAEVEQRRAALLEAQASLAEAKSNADRSAALMKRGATSTQEADQRSTAAATAAARVASAQAQLSTAEQRLNYATIVAPDFGTISARTVVPGQIAAGGAELFKLIRQNRIEWRAEIPEAQISKIRAGMSAKVRRTDGTFAIGKIRTIAPSLDAATRRGTAYVDLHIENGLRPGMFSSGSIELGAQQTRLLPLAAVTMRDGFAYVFVLGADEKVTQRRVQVGRFFNDTVEILDGVTATDAIVARGAGFLRDGDQVRVAKGQVAKS
jgi:HlyD family secretion protein